MAKGQAVDQRIVEMKFDNADFESKVGQTLATLTKLREKTKMEDAGEGMDKLAKSVNNVDISRLADGIDALNQKFSVLGVAGQQVIRNLTGSFMNLANQASQAVLEAPKDGWKEYELYTDSVKTILNSAKDANGLPVTLDQVNKRLAELNEYSDKTIYSFSDMTQNIGKFTNAGVDLDSAVKAIQGVANVAALSGANANDAARAMYNFGQALGSGSIKLIDWKSIENANMATVDFKKNLLDMAEKLGTVRKEGDKYVSTTTNMQGKVSDAFDATLGFNDSLAYQWMTAEVLTKTLERYTNEEDELGIKAMEAAQEVTTFSKMMDTLKESMGSGWMNIWQTIFGDFEEQKNLWTGVYKELDGIIQGIFSFWYDTDKKHKGVLNIWKELGGRDDLVAGFEALWRAAKTFVEPVKDLLSGLFPSITGEGLAIATRDFREFAERLAPAKKVAEDVGKKVEEISTAVKEVNEESEKFKQIVQEIIAGKWGNGQERIDRLKEAGYEFSNLQNAVNGTLGSTKRYETAMTDAEAVGEKVADNIEEQAEVQKNYREEIKKSNDELFVHKGAVENIAYIFLGVSSAVKLAVAVVDKGVESFKKLSGGVHPVAAALGLVLDILGNIGRYMYQLNTWLIGFGSFEETIAGIKEALSSLGGSNKALGSVGSNVSKISKLVDKIGNGFAFAKRQVLGFVNGVKEFVKTNNGVAGIRDKLFAIGEVVAGVLILAFDSLAGVINTAADSASKMWKKFNELSTVKVIKNAYEEAKDAISGFWDTLTQGVNGQNKNFDALHELSVVFSSIARTVGKLVSMAFTFLGNRLADIDKLSTLIRNKLAEQGVLDTVVNIWTKFKAVFKELPDIITKFFQSIQNGKVPTLAELSTNLSGFADSIGQLKEKIKASFGNVRDDIFASLTNAFTNLTNLQLPDKLQAFVDKIKGAFEAFGGVTIEAGDTAKTFIEKVINVFQQVDIGSLAKTGLIGAIGLFVARWSKVGKNASGAFKSLSTFLQNGGKAAVDIKEKYNGFLKIGAAIALIAASIWLMAQIPADRAKQNAIILGIAFAAMAGAILYLTKAKFDTERLKGAGIAFAGMGAAVLLFAASVKMFAAMKPEEVAKGISIVIGSMVLMVAAIRSVGNVSDGAGKAFAGLAAGVLILSVAVRSFAAIKAGALFKGGAAVTFFVFVMAKAIKTAGDANPDGFVNLAKAVVVLVVAIKMIAGMKASKLVKGGAAVTALIFALAFASKSAKDVDGEAFKAMGQAIKILATAMFVLSKIPLLKLVAVSASLVIIFRTIMDAVKELKEIDPKESGKIALALLAMLVPIGGVLYLLATFTDPDSVLKIAVGIAAVLWALSKVAPALEALAKVDLVSGITAVGLLDALLVTVAAIIGGLLYILGSIEEAGSDKMVEGAHRLGEILHAFISGLIFGDVDPSEVITSIGNALNGFGEKIMGFVDALKGMDGSVAENAKNLAVAILAICAAEVLEALTGFIAGKSDFRGFGNAISGVTNAILEINEAVSGDNTFDSKAVNKVIQCVKGMVEIANALPKQGGGLQKLVGHQDLGEFADQMATFIKGGFRTFLASINLLGDAIDVLFVARVMMVKTATKALIDLANSLPRQGGIIQNLFTGNQDLGKFAEQMATFMTGGFMLFVGAVNILPPVDIGKIRSELVPATVELINLSKKLPKDSLIDTIFDGKKDLGEFAAQMADFLTNGYLRFALALNATPVVSVTRITSEVIPATEAMIDLSKTLKDNRDILTFITSKSDLGVFGKSLSDFGVGVKSFTDSVSGVVYTEIDNLTYSMSKLMVLNGSSYATKGGLDIFAISLVRLGAGVKSLCENASLTDEEGMKAVISNISNLHNLLLILSATDYSGISNYIDAMQQVIDVASQLGGGVVDAILSTISDREVDFEWNGDDMIRAWGSGFTKEWIKSYGDDVVRLITEGISNGSGEFVNSGILMLEIWCYQFMNFQATFKLAAAAAYMVNAVTTALTSSTAKTAFKDAGGTATLEFCVGLTKKYEGMLTGAGQSMAKKVLEGLEEYIPDDFYEKGKDAAQGFRDGIDDYAHEAVEKAAKMARDALDAIATEQDSASPSKEARKLGHYGGEGYGLGWEDTIPYVVSSVRKTGHAGLMAMKDTVKKMNSMIGDEIDAQPTITPVIDLSQLSDGMRSTRGLLRELDSAQTGVQAALDISSAHNDSLVAKAKSNRDYTKALDTLVDNSKRIIDATKKNHVAVIDGDYLFGYVDRRFGMA